MQLPTEDSPAQLLSGAQTVDSLRDSGYTTTERAVAELIDNSYEAGANNVILVIVQKYAKHGHNAKRPSRRAIEMYVADDGDGMDGRTLNHGLAFGAGTRTGRRGIGRFGMGLPQASVSQARRFDAWSWQESYGQALHTRVDLDAIRESNTMSVPWPKPATESWSPPPPASEFIAPADGPGLQIPPFLLEDGVIDEVLHGEGANHGTIVGWSKLDRTSWTTAAKVASHVAFFLGRTYRRFLADHDPEPRFDTAHAVALTDIAKSVDLDNVLDTDKARDLLVEVDGVADGRRLFIRVIDREEHDDGTLRHALAPTVEDRGIDPDTGAVKPNDPEYLLPAAATNLQSWGDVEGETREDAPFVLHNRPQVLFVQSRKQGDDNCYPVFITTSHSKLDSRVEKTGTTDFGKHAKRNQGVSVVRADRELLLLDSVMDEPQRRFVGLQVDFPPQLDEVFGVTNNKQEATQLAAAIKVAKDNDNQPLDYLIEHGVLIEDSIPAAIYPVARALRERHAAAFAIVKDQQKSEGRRSSPGKPTNLAPEVKAATEVDRHIPEDELTEGEQDARRQSTRDDFLPPTPEDIYDDVKNVIERGEGTGEIYDDEAIKFVVEMLSEGSGYAFLIEHKDESSDFFRVEEIRGVEQARGSSKIIWLNMRHPVWSHYLNGLRLDEEDLDALGEAQLRDIITKARGVIINMFIAWFRIERGGTETERHSAAITRERWGKTMKHYIRTDDEVSMTPPDEDLLEAQFNTTR